MLGQHQPADAPAGHAEIFGEGVCDNGLGRKFERRLRRLAISQAMINLVGNECDAEPVAGLANVSQGFPAHHRPGRIGRTHQQDSVELLF